MRRLVFDVALLCVATLLAPQGGLRAQGVHPSPAQSPTASAAASKVGTSQESSKKAKPENTEAAASASVQEMKSQQEQAPAAAQAAVPIGPSVEPGQTFLELKYNVDSTRLQGNVDRSFLNACDRDRSLGLLDTTRFPAGSRKSCVGDNHTGEISFFTNQPIFGTRRFEHAVIGRYTDNPRVDPERASLQRFYMKFSGPSFEMNFGDALVNYSRFSFNQNIKGLNLWKNLTKGLRFTGTAGYFADRWGSLYRGFEDFRSINLDCQVATVFAALGTTIPTSQLPTTLLPNGAPASGCVELPAGLGRFVLSTLSPTKPYSRLIGGARLEQKVGPSGWLAFNWSHGSDLLQSLPRTILCFNAGTGAAITRDVRAGCQTGETEVANSRRPPSEGVDSHLVSTDTSLESKRLRLRVNGEWAYSWTAGGTPTGATSTNFVCATQPSIVGASVLDSRCFAKRVGDWAGRFDANQRIRKLTWRVDYSRFQPDFLSANSRAIRDLQDFTVRGEFEVVPQWTIIGSWRRANDNLNGRRNFTSIVRAPEVRFMFRDLPIARRMRLELGYRERNLDTEGDRTKTTCVDQTTKVPFLRPLTPGCVTTLVGNLPQEVEVPNQFQKRSTGIPFLSLALPIGNSQFSFDYEHRHDADADKPALSTDTDRFAFGYRGNYSRGGWDFSPFFRFELERLDKFQHVDPRLSSNDLSPGGGVFLRTLAFDAFDTTRSFQAGFLLETPKYFRIEGQYREFNSLTLSSLGASAALQCVSLGLPATCSLVGLSPQQSFYLNQGFKRPNWRGSVTFKLWNDENKTVTAYYERANNFFDTGDPFVADIKSFRETVVGGTILLRFRR